MFLSRIPPGGAKAFCINGLMLAALLSGCAPDTRFGVLDARYRTPETPVHFRTPRDGIDLSFSGSVNGQDPLVHRRLYRERSDGRNLYLAGDLSNPPPYRDIEERFRFARDRYSLGGLVTWQQESLYSGITAGTGPDWPQAWDAGAFFGFSGGPGSWVLSAGCGIYANRIRRSARFWSYSAALIVDSLFGTRADSVYAPDSVSGWKTDWEIRFAGGAMYRIDGRLAPYLIGEGGTARFWAKPRQGQDYLHAEDASLGIGLEWRPRQAWPMRAEFRSGRSRTQDGWGPPFLQVGLRVTREL